MVGVEFLDTYRRSLTEFTDRVAHVGAEQWEGPTPCTDWDVRALVNHVVYEDRWTVPLVRGASLAEVGDRFEGDLLDGDPTGAVRDAAAEADQAFSEPGALERTVELSFGETPAREYGYQLLADHLVHAWDLAAAVGASRQFDAEVVRAVAEWYADQEDAYRRSGSVAARVDVGPDASDQDRLIAAFGRDPHWRPPA
jgi:uncharacterized protein (TIGR03086 family)